MFSVGITDQVDMVEVASYSSYPEQQVGNSTLMSLLWLLYQNIQQPYIEQYLNELQL